MSDRVTPAISVVNLRVSYGEREILHGISFDVRKGETFVILGGSGSGKSTLLRTLVGLEKPTSGEVWINGVLTSSLDDAALTRLRREQIGFVFQSFQLLPRQMLCLNQAHYQTLS